ncbi:hypothetical protein SVAN01_02224 [Stagonosporopsis vannaccii]|nr:hypothetical protein SVAN01_02224 [Stagonosporopsis vannaccii]
MGVGARRARIRGASGGIGLAAARSAGCQASYVLAMERPWIAGVDKALRHSLTSWAGGAAGLSQTVARLGVPNGKGACGRAEELFLCTWKTLIVARNRLARPGEGGAASRRAGRGSLAPAVRQECWTRRLGDTGAAVQRCDDSSTRRAQAARLGGRCVTTAHDGGDTQRQRTGARLGGSRRQRAVQCCDGGAGRALGQAGRGHQAGCGARPTTIRRSAHERLRPTGRAGTAGGWAVLKNCWRGRRCAAAVDARVRLHACLQHTRSPRHPRRRLLLLLAPPRCWLLAACSSLLAPRPSPLAPLPVRHAAIASRASAVQACAPRDPDRRLLVARRSRRRRRRAAAARR